MRKMTLVIGAIGLSLAPVAPATAVPDIQPHVSQFAYAHWFNIQHMTGNYYGAFAYRYNAGGDDAVRTSTFVFRGSCRRDEAKNGRDSHVVCKGLGIISDVETQDFVVDPTLSSASLRVDTGRHVHEVNWTGQDLVPHEGHSVVARDNRVRAGVGMSRLAKADGKLFGERMRARSDNWSFLYQGASALAKLDARGVDIDFLRDGRVRVMTRFSIKR